MIMRSIKGMHASQGNQIEGCVLFFVFKLSIHVIGKRNRSVSFLFVL